MTEQPAPIPFVPISRQLLDSSVWETDLRVRVLWITMLMTAAEPARRGTVDMTVRALAGRAAMSPEDVRWALNVLESPDPHSRTPGNDGRRIERMDEHRDWGWRILNWGEYQDARGRMLNSARVARYKARHRDQSLPGNGESRSVMAGHMEVEVEVEDEVEDEVEGERTGAVAPEPPAPPTAKAKRFVRPTLIEWETYCRKTWPDWESNDVGQAWSYYEARGWKTIQNWQAAARTCAARRDGAKPRPERQRALIGAHAAPTPATREVDDDSPEWVKEMYRRIRDREDYSDEEFARYGAWLAGEGAA